MANRDSAKVGRRNFNLETVVFKAEQEVTVPIGVNIPADTQYILQPTLVIPRHKSKAQQGPGKLRVLGQLEGFLSCVNSDEVVNTISVPPVEYVTAFTVPTLEPGTNIQVDARLDGVEVDRGDDNVANITAFIMVEVRATLIQELDLVTGFTNGDLEKSTKEVRIQNIIQEVEIDKVLKFTLATPAGAVPTGTEFSIGNLSWEVVDGKLQAEGLALIRVFSLMGSSIDIYENRQRFELDLDFESPNVASSMLDCKAISSEFSLDPETGLELEVVVRALATGYNEQAGEYVTEVQGADALTRRLHLRNRIGESEFKVNLDGSCMLPSEEAVVDLALPRVNILETKALDEKVLVRGMLSLTIYYTDDNQHKRVVVHEEEFSQFFEVVNCTSAYQVKAWAWPEMGTCGEGRYNVPVHLRVEIVEDVEFNAITDIHIVNPGMLPVNASIVLYVVGKEDNLFTVARKFNMSQQMLRDFNALDGDRIYPGQKLMVPIYHLKNRA